MINPPTDVAVLASEHRLDGPVQIHCNLDPRECCCTTPHFANDIRAAAAAMEAAPAYTPNLPAFGEVVKRPPNFSGNSCHDCGGMMIRTGTCETCTECGSQGGCG